MIEMVDLAWRHSQDAEDIEARVLEVLRSGRWLGGPAVEQAESEVARLCGRQGAVAVGCGTDALILGLQALGIRAGARIGVPALTFFATAGAVCAIGAQPVVLDVDDRGLLASVPDDLDAVIPVHLFGNRASVSTAIPVIDDAAQAIGSGISDGRLTAVSSYPTKVLSGAGNGGFVVGDDVELLDRVRRLGTHGLDGPHLHRPIAGHVGRNSRMSAVQAAALLGQLGSLDARIRRRRDIASHYDTVLGPTALRRDPDNPVPTYCLVHPDRDGLSAALGRQGIASTVYYPRSLREQPALAGRIAPCDTPVADRLSRQLLAIPVHAGLDDAQVEQVAAVLRSWV